MVLRLFFLALVVVPFTLIGLPVQLILMGTTPRAWRILPRVFFRLLAYGLGLRVTILGSPPAAGTTLVVANHISWLDIPAIASLLPVRFVAKSDVARYPLVGFLARLQKTIFVDRTRRTDTGRTSAEMGAALGAGDLVLLFAEGTSDIGTHVLPFRSALMGAAQKAMDASDGRIIMIQPMAIAYRAVSGLPLSRQERTRIAWVGDMGVGDNILEILKSGPKDIAIAFGPPIPATGDRKALARHAEGAVRAMLVALNRARPLPSPDQLV